MSAFAAPRTDPESADYRHEALFYAGTQGFLDGVVPFLQDGVEAGEPTLVVVDARKIALLHDALGPDADTVIFADMAEVGANPARIIPAWQDFLDEHAGEGRRVRGVGEPIHPGRDAPEMIECHRHEELLNLAFSHVPGFWLLCPYDTEALQPQDVERARCTHPILMFDGHSTASDVYPGEDAIAAPFDDPLPEPDEVDVQFAFDNSGLAALRAVVADWAAGAGLDERRTADAVLAVCETATNSIRHGGGSGTLRLWREGRRLVAEVRDRGRIDEPLIGRVPPRASQTNGRGVWIANQVCDLVQVRCFADAGVVRVHLRR